MGKDMAFGDRNVEFGLELPNVLSPLVFIWLYTFIFRKYSLFDGPT